MGLLAVGGAATLAWAARPERWARPDPIPRLLAAIARGRSYKVRVHAAAVLARFDDPRATAALATAATRDRSASVRLVVVRLLGRRRRGALKEPILEALEQAKKDPHPGVRAAARQALLGTAAGRTPPSEGPASTRASAGELVVAVGPMGDRTGRASAAVRERMRQEVARNLAALPRVRIAAPEAPGLGFVVDGAISKLELKTTSGEAESTCAVSLVVSRPPRGILLVASGEASVMRPLARLRPAAREQMQDRPRRQERAREPRALPRGPVTGPGLERARGRAQSA
jgi:hypothetical protein